MYQQLFCKVVDNLPRIKASFWLALLAIALLGTSCSTTSESSSAIPASTAKSPSSSKPKQDEQAAITMAVIPWQVSSEQEQKLQPLADYLSKTLKRPFKFEIAKNYETAVELLIQGKVDLAYLGPSSYIAARLRDSQIEPLVSPINQDTKRPWYTSVIITSKTSGIQNLQNLKGKRFAFVSKISASGYVVPMAKLQELGIHPEKDFAAVIFTGSHDKSKQALIKGEVDAIADDRRSYTGQIKQGKIDPTKYSIIWESVPLPSVPIVAASKVSTKLKNTFKQVLLDAPAGLIDPSGAVGVGYTLVQDGDYDIMRDFQKRVPTK
ncbi:phosphate/phosphite/phosphonate ABC transporter substrate-binding protein [Calothrix membranacea FACHB-236]|nr:phosphate/phosphite/phosphonate ABC transporter substrate-binding protein [Calothrix membranacea FACHB-236]